jgi:hypothetical protein
MRKRKTMKQNGRGAVCSVAKNTIDDTVATKTCLTRYEREAQGSVNRACC